MVVTDTETGMLPGIPGSATCVQKFDDSLSSAIHITYRISLRSSSLREPRYPLLKVVKVFFKFCFSSKTQTRLEYSSFKSWKWFKRVLINCKKNNVFTKC